MDSVTTITYGVAIGFLVMGLLAFASPALVAAYAGLSELSIDGRNEVRAVYGGFGLAIAGVVAVAPHWPRFGPGILLTVAMSLFGMAFGRVISRAADGGAGFYPWLWFAIELVGGAALVAALMALP
jgi:hypothetical protein